MGELATVLGLEDLFDILEVAAVDRENERIAREWYGRQRGR